MESVEIRGTLEAISLKEASTCEIKLKAEYDDDLRPLIKRRVVVLVEPEASQPSLPMDKPAAAPGQGQLFGQDGRPRFHVRCETCHTETTQKLFAKGDGFTTYECDVCHSLNQVDDPESAEVVDNPADPADGKTETEGEAGEPVDGAEPVGGADDCPKCPECGCDMTFVPEDNVWQCVNPDCLHTMTPEKVEAEEPLSEDPQGEEMADEFASLRCPECGSSMTRRPEEAKFGTLRCVAPWCGNILSEAEAREIMAKGEKSDELPVEDELAGLCCPACGGKVVRDESTVGPDNYRCETCHSAWPEAAAKVWRWKDPSGRVYEVARGLGDSKWGLFERKENRSLRRIKAVEMGLGKLQVVAAAIDYAHEHGWEITDDEEAGNEPEQPVEVLGTVRHWCQMCQVICTHDLVMIGGEKKLRCGDCGRLYEYHERKQGAGEEAGEGAA